MDPLSKDEFKQAVKETLTEWVDSKFESFGRWSATGIAAAAFGAMVYFILKMSGWHYAGQP